MNRYTKKILIGAIVTAGIGSLLSSCGTESAAPQESSFQMTGLLFYDVSASIVVIDSTSLREILSKSVNSMLQNPSDRLLSFYIAAQTCDANPIVPEIIFPNQRTAKDNRLAAHALKRANLQRKKFQTQAVSHLMIGLKKVAPKAPYTDIHGILCILMRENDNQVPVKNVTIISDLRHDAHGINITRGFESAHQAKENARNHAPILKKTIGMADKSLQGIAFRFIVPVTSDNVLQAKSGGYLQEYWTELLSQMGSSEVTFETITSKI